MKFWIIYEGAMHDLDLDLYETVGRIKIKIWAHLALEFPINLLGLKDPKFKCFLEDGKKLGHYYAFGRYLSLPPYKIEVIRYPSVDGIMVSGPEVGRNITQGFVRPAGMPGNVVAPPRPPNSPNLSPGSSHESSMASSQASTAVGNSLKPTFSGAASPQAYMQEIQRKLDHVQVESNSQVEGLLKEQEETQKKLEEVQKELALKDAKIQEVLTENENLRKEIELMNETMAAMPMRMEADLGIEDSRVDELSSKNLALVNQIKVQEKLFQDEIEELNSLLASKDTYISSIESQLDDAKANILSLANVVKNQEAEIDRLKQTSLWQVQENDQKIAGLLDYQAKILAQNEALKAKWRYEAKRIFHESMSYVQKNFKTMLAVEELGFLKPLDDFTMMSKSSLGLGQSGSKMGSAESSMSIMTTSSSYEKLDQNEEGGQEGGEPEEKIGKKWDVIEESEEI